MDCRTPTEAALLKPSSLQPGDIQDYREELSLSLSSAREIAAKAVQKAQQRYKASYDSKLKPITYRVSDWVMAKFPADETGRLRKLSRPWHGPYRISAVNGPDVSVSKVYYPQDGGIQVHQSRVKPCTLNFPAGFYWYGGKRRGPGRPPKWVEQILADNQQNVTTYAEDERTSLQEDTNYIPQETRNTVTDNKPMLEPIQPKRMSSKYNLRQSPRRPKKLTDQQA